MEALIAAQTRARQSEEIVAHYHRLIDSVAAKIVRDITDARQRLAEHQRLLHSYESEMAQSRKSQKENTFEDENAEYFDFHWALPHPDEDSAAIRWAKCLNDHKELEEVLMTKEHLLCEIETLLEPLLAWRAEQESRYGYSFNSMSKVDLDVEKPSAPSLPNSSTEWSNSWVNVSDSQLVKDQSGEELKLAPLKPDLLGARQSEKSILVLIAAKKEAEERALMSEEKARSLELAYAETCQRERKADERWREFSDRLSVLTIKNKALKLENKELRGTLKTLLEQGEMQQGFPRRTLSAPDLSVLSSPPSGSQRAADVTPKRKDPRNQKRRSHAKRQKPNFSLSVFRTVSDGIQYALKVCWYVMSFVKQAWINPYSEECIELKCSTSFDKSQLEPLYIL